MEARAFVRGLSISPRKMRVVANLVRGRQVEDAVGMLSFMPKKAAVLISHAVKSAVANAVEMSGQNVAVENLRVATIQVDGGPTQKRTMPRAQGRGNRINKKSSHLTVVVSDGAKGKE